jgi:predicted PurR-regulated permease PerM
MKRIVLYVGILLIVFLLSIVGCATDKSEQQLARIEAQLQTLSSSINSMQQELLSMKRALTETQEKTRTFQQQLQETMKNVTSVSTTPTPAINRIYVTSPMYYPPFYMRSRFLPPPPHHFPPVPPFPFLPFPPFH